MRSFIKTDENVKILYPEDVMFCYNPEILTMTKGNGGSGNEFYMYITLENEEDRTSYNDLRVSANGVASLDLSSYTKLFFKKEDLESVKEKSETGKSIKVKVLYKSKADYESSGNMNEATSILEFTSFCIWGALNIGEVFNPSRNLTWFRNFPFTFGFFQREENRTAIIRQDDQNFRTYTGTAKYGACIVNLDPVKNNLFPGASRLGIFRIDYSDEGIYLTFDISFDNSFHPVGDKSLIIQLNIDDSETGTYLRWIDKHGFYQYYLFKEGTSTLKTKDEGNNLLKNYLWSGRYYNGISRVQGKNAQQSMRVCAPLVDEETFKRLTDLLYSPIVDMYYGTDEEGEPIFVPVNVSAGSTVLSGESYKDFELEIELPQKITQRL